jgi:dipeptidyl aminopeptidase/acylaminoacyl peptidase
MIYALPEKTPSEILVGLNDRDPQVHDVYRLDLRTGRRTLVQKNQANVADWEVDLEGRVRLGMRMTKDGGTELLRVEPRGALTPIYACTAEETCNVVRVHKDGRRAYVASNRGTPDLTRLVLLDLATGKEELVESDPDGDTDFGGARFSDATEELLATFYVGDRLRTYPKDPRFAQDWEVVRKALPDGDVEFRNGTEDDRRWIVTVTSDVDPGATYLYDRATARVQLLYRPYPDLPLAHLAPMKPVRYRARDGVTIRGYLTVPKGLAARGLPTIVLPHGGPWARDEWGYAPLVQFLANRGYAVLQPNFRGSTGFGKKFLNLGNGQWGTGTMQHDLTDGARWLAAEGIADPKRIGILGGSYGGYATLAGLAFTPDLYACGVDIVGPSSILTLLRSIPPYWAPMKKIFAIRVGDVEKPEDAARLQAQSPLHAARAIKAPLLVIQGANDPRVKKAESDQIIVALRDLGRQVEYVVAEDEGHGFAGQTNRIAMNVIIERFLAKHLGGRHQAGMAPEIAERVKSLTVPLERVKSAAAPLR